MVRNDEGGRSYASSTDGRDFLQADRGIGSRAYCVLFSGSMRGKNAARCELDFPQPGGQGLKMRILYTGQLTRDHTCDLRARALERLGHKVIGIDYLPYCEQYS